MNKITILNQKENPMFSRKEIEINLETDITPKITEAEEFVSKEFSANPESVKIKKIKGKFGSNNFIITANIYSSKENKDKIEPKLKKGKGEIVREEKK